jgi:hypothetical protein
MPSVRLREQPIVNLDEIKSLRDQAASCRSFAQHSSTRVLREEFLRRAREFDEAADRLEAKDEGVPDNS